MVQFLKTFKIPIITSVINQSINQMVLSTEIRLFLYVVGLYVCFIYWGYLQEKLTSKPYTSITGETLSWDFPFAMNFCMAMTSFLIAYTLHQLSSSPPSDNSNDNTSKNKSKSTTTSYEEEASFFTYWKAGLTNSLASPVGYASLKYITFPMMVLTKSSKPIPVMLMGVFLYKRTFPIYKYISVFLVVGGICLFSSVKKESSSSSSSPATTATLTTPPTDSTNMMIGIALILVNLILDGYTNNEQDKIFASYRVAPLQMMANTNLWQSIFIMGYLSVSAALRGVSAELPRSVTMLLTCPTLQYDIALFCICACLGQVLIFTVMKEFGSLVWITISITRKLFTILLSIFAFNHQVKMVQWMGIGLVFVGLTVETVMGYLVPKPGSEKEKKV